VEGEVREHDLVDALRSIDRSRRTGILTVQGTDEIIAFSFLAGAIVGADALNQSLEEGLGEVLSRQHLIDPEEFGRLAAEQEAGGGRVVDLLVERSFLSRAQLLESLRLHTYRLCLEALSWTSGEYRFYEGDEVAHEAGVEPLTVAELLVRASDELGEAGPLGAPAPAMRQRLRTIGAGTPIELQSGLVPGGSERTEALLGLLDGRRTLREAVDQTELADFEARLLAGEWIRAGIVETVGEARTPSPEAQSKAPAPEADGPMLGFELSDVVQTEPDAERETDPSAPATGRRQHLSDLALEALGRWSNRIFCVALLAAGLALLLLAPARLLGPFPWQGSLRQGLASVQRSAERVEIENGARAFFLLHGRFPDTVAELEPYLSTPGVSGRWRLAPGPTSLVIQSTAGEDLDVEQPSWTTTLAGDFLLDPAFYESGETAEGPLLVLLD
jgi:hypothetical protein